LATRRSADHPQQRLGAQSRAEAQERAERYLARKWDSIDTQLHSPDGHPREREGYEFYGGMAKTTQE